MKQLTVRDACARLHCSRWTLDRLFKAGKLTKIIERRKVYVDAAELRRFKAQRDRTQRGKAQRDTPALTATAPALSAEDIAALIDKVTRIEQHLAEASPRRVA